MKFFLLLISVFISIELAAKELSCYKLTNKSTIVEIDENTQKIIIKKLLINNDILGERVLLSLKVPYPLAITNKTSSDINVMTFSGNDFIEGSGIKVVVKINKDFQGDIAFRIQYEERALLYNPVNVKVAYKKCSKN